MRMRNTGFVQVGDDGSISHFVQLSNPIHMNTEILLISIIGSLFFIALALLFIAGYLFRCDLARIRAAGSSTPHPTRDPLALKDLLVGFFAHSTGASRIIRLLAARQKPVGYRGLVDDFRFDEQWRRDSDELPASAMLAVLGLMQVAGVVRITRHGMAITEVGREVHRRIAPSPGVQKPHTPAAHSSTGNGRRAATTLSSADRTVLRELRKRSRTLIHQ